MTEAINQPTNKPTRNRLFYPLASLTLLVVTLIGFRLFYLHWQAFPGRPLTPPIRTLVVIHGILMTLWMLLAVLQPLLVAANQKRAHKTLGKFAAVLAVGIVLAGCMVAVKATQVAPPELIRFGLAPKEFLTVPLGSILLFALLVGIGVWNRGRPEVHRPMMLMASLAIVTAALARIPGLGAWYAGTWMEHLLSAFGNTLILGGLMLIVKCVIEKRFDRWFATALGILAMAGLTASLAAKTEAWGRLASALTG